jgi:hypothetical protein
VNRRSALRWISIAVCLLSAVAHANAAPVPVTLPDFGDMAVDEANGSVYITSGPSGDAITVLNLDGSPKTLITGVGDAQQIERAIDGSAIYVALQSNHAIGVIDPTTRAMTTVDLGAGRCPSSIAQSGEVLWFTYGACTYGPDTLGAMRLSDRHVTLQLGSAARVVSSPGLGSTIGVWNPGRLQILDVSGGSTVAPVIVRSEAALGGVDMVAAPDGSELIVGVSDWWCRATGYATSDLLPRTIYGCVGRPSAVAVRSDGMLALGDETYRDEVRMYWQGHARTWRTYHLSEFAVAPRGLAFGARDLYIVFKNFNEHAFARITPRLASSLRLRTPSTMYAFGATTTVTAHLASGSPNRTVAVYAQERGRTRQLLKSGPVDANGDISVSTTLLRNTTFTATFAGDDRHDPAQTSQSVKVKARATIVMTKVAGRSGAFKLVRSGSAPTAFGTIGPYHAGDCARFVVQRWAAAQWQFTWRSRCFRLGSRSSVYLWFDSTWRPDSRARIRLLWEGDDENAASSSRWTYLKFVR